MRSMRISPPFTSKRSIFRTSSLHFLALFARLQRIPEKDVLRGARYSSIPDFSFPVSRVREGTEFVSGVASFRAIYDAKAGYAALTFPIFRTLRFATVFDRSSSIYRWGRRLNNSGNTVLWLSSTVYFTHEIYKEEHSSQFFVNEKYEDSMEDFIEIFY